MSFTANIPTVNQSLGTSRVDIVNNFSNLFNTAAVNHYDGNATGAGKHKFVQMPAIPNIGQPTIPASGGDEISLYSKSISSRSTLFYTRDSSLTEIQLTGVNPSAANPGYTYLPGGLLIQFGAVTLTVTNPDIVTLPTSFTDVASFYGVSVTCRDISVNSIMFSAAPLSSSSFRIFRNNALVKEFFYIAIGAKA